MRQKMEHVIGRYGFTIIMLIMINIDVDVTCQPILLTDPDVLIDGESANITCSKDDPIYFIDRTIDGVTIQITSCTVANTVGCTVSEISLNTSYTVYKTNTTVTIYIASVSRARESGKWICRNFLETEKVEKDIDVKVPVRSVTVIRNGSEFRDGSLTSVSCRINGTPHPSANITWFIANRRLPDTSNPLQYEAKKSDNGKRLKCSATNGYGGSQSNYLMLDIKYRVSYVDIININSLTLNVGQKKTVTCQADGNPLPIITWSIINGAQLSTSPTGLLSSTYEYTANKLDNGGYLQCSATNGIVGGAIPDSVKMDIRYSPVLHIDTTSPYKIIEGRQLVLKCIVTDSNPFVTVDGYKWLKNNVPVPGQSSSEYNIPSAQKTDSGNYICTAHNEVGSTNSTLLIINVLYGPTVAVTPERLTVKEDSIINLTCSAQSNPSSILMWHKPDGTIVSTVNLVISRINRNQTGDYICQATNILNPTDPSDNTESRTDNKTVAVIVQYLDPVDINVDKTKVEEGDKIIITCSTQSNPVALITWFNGSDIIKRIHASEGSYVIDRASCLDTSVYRCNATNDIFINGYTSMTTVLVHCSPRQDPRNTPATIVTGNISDVVDLVANVISYPQPSFTWYYIEDDVVIPISNSNHFQKMDTNSSINTYTSTLRINITSFDFYQSYGVNISNGENKSTTLHYNLNAQSVPDSPFELKVRSTYKTICLEWKPGFNGGATQTFIVQHSTDDNSWIDSSPISDINNKQKKATNDRLIKYCIPDLEPKTQYYVRMVAQNAFGRSQFVYFTASDNSTGVNTKTAPYKTTVDAPSRPDTILIGGVVAAVCVIIVIIIVASLLVKKRRREKPNSRVTDNENGSTVALHDVSCSPNGMIIDYLADYVSSGDLIKEENDLSDAINGKSKTAAKSVKSSPDVEKSLESEYLSSTVFKQESKKSAVNKKLKSNENTKNSPTKIKKGISKPKSRGDVYENIGIFDDINNYENSTNPVVPESQKKDDALVYVDLNFDGQKQSTAIKGKSDDDFVEYSGIDYTKRGPTPPPDSDISDEEMGYLPPIKE